MFNWDKVFSKWKDNTKAMSVREVKLFGILFLLLIFIGIIIIWLPQRLYLCVLVDNSKVLINK